MTGGPLLGTKLHTPVSHGRLVPRPRLAAQMARATEATLTLVSAPAGFGKTTVMSDLAAQAGAAHVAWLSLDAEDDDPLTFWTYVIEAIDRAVPGVGAGARMVLSGASGTADAALTTLLNDLADLDRHLVLMLDDVHVIESAAIHEQLAYLLDHLPARAHVVMGTRADPAIPLARLRARGALVEIRANDLRFSAAEAAAYLEAMGLSLGEGDVDALEGRTEGWIAALQLAALSLQGRSDATEFITAFSGDHRYIVDYLVEEVLRRQPPDTREFLLETSVLPRFSGALADAVTARQGSAATIEALERGNLFVVALDSQRRWYRYHHLFAAVLAAHLATERPDAIPILHRRASDWLDEHGDRAAAIEHALRAGDPDRTAELVELAVPELRQYRSNPTLRRWVEALPRAVLERRPVLAASLAGAILTANEIKGVESLLTTVERGLASPESIAADPAELRRLPAMVELYRAAVAKMQGDLEANVAHARRVLDMVAADDDVGRGGAETFIGLAYWGTGDLETGFRWYNQGMASLGRAGMVADVVGGSIVGADIRLATGRLRDVERIYADGLALATRSQPPLRGASDMHTGLADVAYQRNHLDEALVQLEANRHLGDEFAFPRDPYRRRVVRARILQAQGQLDPALTLLDEAERLYLSDFSPDVRPVAAIRARILVAHGRIVEARAWASSSGLTAEDPVSYVREFEHTTLARILVAGDEADARATARALLDRLLDAATEDRRDGSRLEILIVQALARHAAGDQAQAFAALDAAAAIAEPEGFVRVFLDEGPAMTRLVKAAARRSAAPALLKELGRAAGGPDVGAPTGQTLLEPLSERELDVLRLLRSDLDGPAIANELVVSLNTLRTHTKNIYGKLGVGSRRAAVRRAEELDLL